MADNWYALPSRSEGIQILDDGTFLLTHLREAGKTYDATYDNSGTPDLDGRLLTLKARRIRATLAIPLDHTIKYGYKIADIKSELPTGPANAESVNSQLVDAANAYPRTHYVQTETYERWLRKESWPIPETIIDPKTGQPTKQAENKLGSQGNPKDALRDDLTYLQNDAKRTFDDVCKLGGETKLLLKGLCFDIAPGQEYSDMSGSLINRVVKQVVLRVANNTTELIFE